MSYADVERALVPALAAATGHRVVTDLPADLGADLPLYQVAKVGGSGIAPGFDYVEIDVDAYGGDREGAVAAAEAARWYLTRELVGPLGESMTVTRVRADALPRIVLYENPALRRAVATYGLWIKHTV